MPFWKRARQAALADPDVAAVEAAVQPLWETYVDRPERLTPAQSALLDVWVTHGMVDNGGLAHFVETTGDRADAVVSGFRALGLDDYARLIERTLELYPTARADDPDQRLSASASWVDGGPEQAELDELDEQAFAIHAGGAVERAAAAFVRTHADDFSVGGR